MLRAYILLAKPGIILGNLFITVAGFLLAADGHIRLSGFAATVAGLGLVIGSACMFNNYIDRGIDAKMSRTKKRVQAWQVVPAGSVLPLAALLVAAGEWLIFAFANSTAALIALFGFVMYVAAYAFFKRKSVFGTIVGSIPGAVPPVVGYTAAGGRLDLGAWILFVMLVLWQMPHFYAISIYRLKDYKAAGLPVMSVKKGIKATKLNIVGYMATFLLASFALWFYGYAGYVYLLIMAIVGLWWLRQALAGFNSKDDVAWAKGVFKFSLIVLVTMSVLISFSWFLP